MGDKRRNKASGLIAKNWQKYERAILDPVKAGRVQRAETRRAFYAGATALGSGAGPAGTVGCWGSPESRPGAAEAPKGTGAAQVVLAV